MTSVTIDGDAQLKRASYQLEPLLVLTRCAIKIISHIRERALHRGFAAPLAGPRPWGV